MKRRLKINLSELIFAFEHSDSIRSYLDTETGQIIEVAEETFSELDMLEAEAEEPIEDITTYLRQNTDLPGWQRDALLEAVQVEAGLDERYLAIPQMESYEGYNQMVEFIATVEDEHLQELLDLAVRGKGAFRRFKDVLGRDPAERERWFRFKDEQMRVQAVAWLGRHDIELIGEDHQEA